MELSLKQLFPERLGKVNFTFAHFLGTFLPLDPPGWPHIVPLGAAGWTGRGTGRRPGAEQSLSWAPRAQAFPGFSLAWAPAPCRPPAHRSPLTGERVNNLEQLPLNEYRERIQVHTDKGTEVATNLVIVCNGIRINSSAYRSAFGKQGPVPNPRATSSPSGRHRPHRPLPRESGRRPFSLHPNSSSLF